MKEDNFQIDKEPLLELPLIHMSEQQNEKLNSLVDDMLETLKNLETTSFEEDKKFLKQRIEILDEKINSIVYHFYRLNKDDIEVI